ERCLSPQWSLCRADSQGRQARRPPDRRRDEIRASYQSQDSQSAWFKHSKNVPCARRRGDRVRRREFITLLGGAAASWPLAARAQQSTRLPKIGLLGTGTPAVQGQWIAAFMQRMRELGWIEGRSVAFELRWAEARSERFTEIATEFLQL